MVSKRMAIRGVFSEIIEPLSEELNSLVICKICGEDQTIIRAAELSWSAIHGNLEMSFVLSCGCKEGKHIKLLPGFDEGWLEIVFTVDEIYLNEIQIPFGGDLINKRRLKTIKYFGWSDVQKRLANFLRLPFGFEDGPFERMQNP